MRDPLAVRGKQLRWWLLALMLCAALIVRAQEELPFANVLRVRAVGVAGVVNFNPEGQQKQNAHLAGAVGMAVFSATEGDDAPRDSGEQEPEQERPEGSGEQEPEGSGKLPEGPEIPPEGGDDQIPQSRKFRAQENVGNDFAGVMLSNPGCRALARAPEDDVVLGFTTESTLQLLAMAPLGRDRVIGVTSNGTIAVANGNQFARAAGSPSGPSGPVINQVEDVKRSFSAKGGVSEAGARDLHAQNGPIITCNVTNPGITRAVFTTFGAPMSNESWGFVEGDNSTAHLSSQPGHVAVFTEPSGRHLVFIADPRSHIIAYTTVDANAAGPSSLKRFFGVPGVSGEEARKRQQRGERFERERRAHQERDEPEQQSRVAWDHRRVGGAEGSC